MKKALLLEKIKNKQINYADIGRSFLKDEDVVCELLRAGMQSLYMTNKRFVASRRCVVAALENSSTNFNSVPYELQNDIDIINMVIEKDGNILSQLNKINQDNKEIVLKAIRNRGEALFYASDRLKDDYDIVLEAIKQNAFSFQYISKRLKRDESLIREALMPNNGESAVLFFLNSDDMSDKNFLVKLIKFKASVFKFLKIVRPELTNDIEFLMAIKDEIEELKDSFKEEYESIIMHEREQNLLKDFENLNNQKNIKKRKI